MLLLLTVYHNSTSYIYHGKLTETYLRSTSVVSGVCTWVGTAVCAAHNLIWSRGFPFVFVTLHTNKCKYTTWSTSWCMKCCTEMVSRVQQYKRQSSVVIPLLFMKSKETYTVLPCNICLLVLCELYMALCIKSFTFRTIRVLFMQFNFPLQPFTAKLHDSEEVPVKNCYDHFNKAAAKTNVIWS